MLLDCPYCHKLIDATVTKLVSRCTECNKDFYSSDQSKYTHLWRELGKKLTKSH
jgi:hypothetical protein